MAQAHLHEKRNASAVCCNVQPLAAIPDTPVNTSISGEGPSDAQRGVCQFLSLFLSLHLLTYYSQKGRAKKGHTDVSSDTDFDSNSDSDSSDAPSSPEAHQSSKALADIIANALDYAYEVYSKFLTKTGCHPYLTNAPSCQKASKAFYGYFMEHEGLIEDSEVGPLVHKLDDDDARKLFIILSKKHNEAKKKGKRRIDEDMPTKIVPDSHPVPDKTNYIDANKKACVGQALHENAIFEQQHPQNLQSSPKAFAQRPNNGIQYPWSRVKNSQPRVEIDIPQLHNKGREYGGNLGPQGPRGPLKEKRNLPEVAMAKKY